MTSIDFTGRVAAITGAGGGLGKTYALELAKRNCKVVVNDLGSSRDGSGNSHSMADQVVEEIRNAGGEAVASYDGIHTPEGGKAVIDTALEHFGKLDILIHNAGIIRDRSFSKMTIDEWNDVINVHLNGAFHVAHPAFLAMRENQYGRIIFTTSVSGLFGNFGQANYSSAKMGQVGLTQTLAIEGSRYGILVNAISPAALTRMTEDLDKSTMPAVSSDPGHVTPAVIYLASEANQDTGTVIHASNGFYGRVQTAYNPGTVLSTDQPVDAETIAANWNQITSMDELQIQKPEKPYLVYVYEKASQGK